MVWKSSLQAGFRDFTCSKYRRSWEWWKTKFQNLLRAKLLKAVELVSCDQGSAMAWYSGDFKLVVILEVFFKKT